MPVNGSHGSVAKQLQSETYKRGLKLAFQASLSKYQKDLMFLECWIAECMDKYGLRRTIWLKGQMICFWTGFVSIKNSIYWHDLWKNKKKMQILNIVFYSSAP